MKRRTFLSVWFTSLLSSWFGRADASAAGDDGSTEKIMYEDVEILVDDAVIESGDLFRIVEPLWWTVNIYDGPAAYERSLAEFSNEQKLLHAIVWYDSEVQNGGHDQFFFNSTGIVWANALAGFRAAGMTDAADLLQEAADRLGGKPSFDRNIRHQQLDRLDAEGFDDLDDRYYELEEESFHQLMDYVLANRLQFYFEGTVKKPTNF